MNNIQEDIIKRINTGDTKAFKKLYETFYVYLSAVAIKYIYNAEIAKEIVNDVFINVWKNRKTLPYPVKTYLVKATQNHCLNHLRKKHLEEVSLSERQEQLLRVQEQLIVQDAHPLVQLEKEEFQREIIKAIEKLPEKCKNIFIQHIYHDKTYEEIAQNNNISSSTVRVQIKIGLAKLKELFSDISFLFFLF